MGEPTLPPWIVWVSLLVLGLVLVSWSRLIARLWNGSEPIPRRRQRRVPWSLDGAVLAGFFLMGAVASLFADTGEASVEIGFSVVFAQLSTLLLFATLSVGWLLMQYRSKAPFTAKGIALADFGLGGTDEQQVRDLGLGVMAFAVMLPLVYAANAALVLILGTPTAHPAIEELMATPTTETIFSVILLAVISAPLFEELAFRVLLQGGLQRLAPRNAWWPTVVSSLAFGLSHTNQGYAFMPITVLAFGLGYVYRQTHSYPAVVAMHMAFNGLSLAVAIAAGQAGLRL